MRLRVSVGAKCRQYLFSLYARLLCEVLYKKREDIEELLCRYLLNVTVLDYLFEMFPFRH